MDPPTRRRLSRRQKMRVRWNSGSFLSRITRGTAQRKTSFSCHASRTTRQEEEEEEGAERDNRTHTQSVSDANDDDGRNNKQ